MLGLLLNLQLFVPKTIDNGSDLSELFTSDKEALHVLPMFVCVSLSKIRLLKNACMDLDEMLHVDRYRDMINC